MIKVGDKVRFLNEVGGGKVVRVESRQNLVYVEDEDGFEVPMLITECVVVPEVNPNTNFPRQELSAKNREQAEQVVEKVAAPRIEEKPEPIVEVAGGDTLNAMLAFFPTDIKRMDSTGYECYLVNDSNYFLFYNLIIGEAGKRRSVAQGVIEPNMQELLCEISKPELNDWERLRIQAVAFKKDKEYDEQAAIDHTQKMNVVRFYKLHSFGASDYFDEPHMLIDLKPGKQPDRMSEQAISADKIKEAMMEKKDTAPAGKKSGKRERINQIIEVDLHINNLLDTTAGMSNADMLEYQLSVFHKTLEENRRKKGQRIVFIHGKGEGVLRSEIEKQLKHRYKNYYFQDASFREYGYGATMVTIR